MSAGEEQWCTVDRENTAIRVLFSPQICIFIHMDYLKNANSVLIVRLCVCVLFTGCGGADAVFAESWPLALQAAMSRALALQRASL